MTKISDLCVELLQLIFLNLNVIDLINLADLNTIFRSVVMNDYRLKFDSTLILSGGKSTSLFYTYDGKLIFSGYRPLLRFIRVFGFRCNSIYCRLIRDQKFIHNVNTYINIYCIHLESIIFRCIYVNFYSVYERKFEKLKILCFEFCSISPNMSHLSLYFPKLEQLLIFDTSIENVPKFIARYERLKYFHFKDTNISEKDLEVFQKLNISTKIIRIYNWLSYLIERRNFLK